MSRDCPTRRTFIELAAATMMLASPLTALADELVPTDEQLGMAEGEGPLESAANENESLDADSGGTVNVYRRYNKKSGDHRYTTPKKERDSLKRATIYRDRVALGIGKILVV